ncbi:helix-turn-helix domain-containing protein [uncultured Bacteroides sp.]|uniref:helix-turn-helix domain-containing protein n=1 Tax=uncultured Bacteroides sp. TaxID=162156 RepID=UPI0025EDFA9A|nr:helix-turn-helix domain-containing protein [uncultured Bacteroides sp.]
MRCPERDVAFYAEELCISSRYLSCITKEIGQTTAKSFIDSFLILELKVALQSTDLSLKEIAEKYRFPGQSFFGRFSRSIRACRPRRSGRRRDEEGRMENGKGKKRFTGRG